MATLRSKIVAGVLACVVLLGGLWFLNNTRAGMGVKCSLLNDMGACFIYEFSAPIAPPAPLPTENPAVAAERRRQEEEARRQAAAERAQREADAAVAAAATELEWAVDALANAAEAASDEASLLGDPADEVRAAVEAQRALFEELAAMIAAGSTGEFWVDDVSFLLYDVEFARNDVDFARDGVEFAAYAIEDARDKRDPLARDVESAMAGLQAAQSRHPDAARPGYSAAIAEADLRRLLAAIDDSIAAHEAVQGEVEALIAEADAVMAQAIELAASVGAQ